MVNHQFGAEGVPASLVKELSPGAGEMVYLHLQMKKLRQRETKFSKILISDPEPF